MSGFFDDMLDDNVRQGKRWAKVYDFCVPVFIDPLTGNTIVTIVKPGSPMPWRYTLNGARQAAHINHHGFKPNSIVRVYLK